MSRVNPMRRMARGIGAVAVAALMTAACASAPADQGVETAQIVVDNSGTSISNATIYLVPENGVRQHLGSVSLSNNKTFEVNPQATEQYVLVADMGLEQLTSNPFILTGGDTVEWDMDVNTVQLVGER